MTLEDSVPLASQCRILAPTAVGLWCLQAKTSTSVHIFAAESFANLLVLVQTMQLLLLFLHETKEILPNCILKQSMNNQLSA